MRWRLYGNIYVKYCSNLENDETILILEENGSKLKLFF